MKKNIKFSYLVQKYQLPKVGALHKIINSFSPIEKSVFWIIVTTFAISTFAVFLQANNEISVQIPVRGGVVREGVIGAPRFINPLLALTDTDRDLTELIYSGLMRPGPKGTLIPDLAKRYSISSDGTEYTFVLKDDARFQDGVPVTADDIVYTVKMAQDSAIKSPRRADWDGVQVKKINAREVKFILKRPYAPFLENTTMGILPRHIWLNVSPQEFAFSNFNVKPIGSGPFKLNKIYYNSAGIPTLYDLRAFNGYTLGHPFINKVLMYFYDNEDALLGAYSSGTITSFSSISSSALKKYLSNNSDLLRIAFPRIFAIFFNQNKNHIFADKSVRVALNVLLDKQYIVNKVLNGYGTVINSPIPPKTVKGQEHPSTQSKTNKKQRQEKAKSILEKDGWKFDTDTNLWTKGKQILTFSIATANTPDLKKAAQIAASEWGAAGIPVKVNVFDTGDLNQNVIRPREYEALLFGEVVGRSLDLFAFWHSSQKNDPGLNIALYTNSTVDKLLAKARTVSDKAKRDEIYLKFEKEIKKDSPAIFLYAPDFLYVVPKDLSGESIKLVTTPSERFSGIYLWYTQTEHVWNFFQ